MLRLSPIAALLALAGCTGCNGDDAAPIECGPPLVSDGGTTELPAEIDDILERRCRPCHSDPVMMFAPMSLVTWEDVQSPLPAPRDDETVYQAIGVRIDDPRFPMPPVTFPQLSDDERAALNDWVGRCAPPARD